MGVAAVRLDRSRNAAGDLVVRLGVGLLDEYLEFLAGRCRPGWVLARRSASSAHLVPGLSAYPLVPGLISGTIGVTIGPGRPGGWRRQLVIFVAETVGEGLGRGPQLSIVFRERDQGACPPSGVPGPGGSCLPGSSVSRFSKT